VRSRRGSDGGHALALPASEITLGAVVRTVAGAPAAGHGTPDADPAYRGASAHLPDVWSAMDASLRSVLDQTTLEQVLHGRLPAHVDRLAHEEPETGPDLLGGVWRGGGQGYLGDHGGTSR
jgi:DNA-binding IscR family transcriptional regulator